MLNAYDLQRVRAEQAAACLVLANKFCGDPGKACEMYLYTWAIRWALGCVSSLRWDSRNLGSNLLPYY